MVRLIDLLAAEGLVERREDPTDRRAKVLRSDAAWRSQGRRDQACDAPAAR